MNKHKTQNTNTHNNTDTNNTNSYNDTQTNTWFKFLVTSIDPDITIPGTNKRYHALLKIMVFSP